MKTTFILPAAAFVLGAGAASAHDHAAAKMGYALANDGTTLAVMADLDAPAEIMTFSLATPVSAIAYRPVTGDLLGIADGVIVRIDPATGAQTDLDAMFNEDATLADGAMVAFDFNNAIDAVRAVSSAGDNLVYFPEGFGDNDARAGTVIRVTDLAWAEGDTNAGGTPNVFANAYTNAINGMTAESTFQYVLDANSNALASLANNEGTLTSVGYLTVDGEMVDLSPMGGFDIVSPEQGIDMAYAILQMEGADTAGLYSIDLETAEATLLADLGMGGFTGFAASMGGM